MPALDFRFILRSLFGLLALLPVLVLPAFAQESANIVGQLRLTGGALPTERIRVTLHTRGMMIGDTYTDNEGRFGFYQLPANVYHVRVSQDGYQPVERTVTMSPVAIATQHVQITLTPVEKTGPVAPPGPASGGNPYMVSATDFTKKFSPQAVKEFEKGVQAEQEKKDEEAIRYYKKAISIEPGFYPARNNLGALLISKKDFKEAEKQFEKVIEFSPNDGQGYFNLGNVYCLTERYADAERTIHEGLKRQPDAALGHFLMGYLYLRAGFLDEAEKRLTWTLQLDPLFSKARIEMANLYMQRKQPEKAVAELKLFIEKYPGDPMLPQVKKLLAKLEAK